MKLEKCIALTLVRNGDEMMRKRVILTVCLVLSLAVLLAVAASAAGSTEIMEVGYARRDITPAESVPMAGYGNTSERMSTGLLDSDYPLYTTCIAMRDAGGKTVLLLTNDLIGANQDVVNRVRASITEALGIPGDQIMITGTHTHSGPDVGNGSVTAYMKTYRTFLVEQMTDAARAAVQDLAVVDEMSLGSVEVENMNYVRHYTSYFSGIIGDNHGTLGKGDAYRSTVTETDRTMFLLRFTRKNAEDVVIANWRAHATLTGGGVKTDLSPDYVGSFRKAIESALGCKFAYFQGASGNVNPTSRVTADRSKPYYTTNYVTYGQNLSYFALQCLNNNMKKVEVGRLRTAQVMFEGNVNKSYTYEQYQKAREIQTVWTDTSMPRADRQTKCIEMGEPYNIYSPYHANAIVRNYQATYETRTLELNAISIGTAAAFVTAPNELFDTNAVQLEEFVKSNNLFQMTFTLCYANSTMGYIPSAYAYEYGCYEADTTYFAKGTGELVEKQFEQMLMGLSAYCECGGAADGMPGHTCSNLNWEPWSNSTALPTGTKNIYLTTDVTLPQSWSGSAGQTLRIDLNGHSLRSSTESVISLKNGVNLAITDTLGKRNGSVVGSGRAILVEGGSLTLYAGTVIAGTGAVSENGGAVYVGSGGSFTMWGGSILGGTANSGGSVAVAGRFDMKGGSILNGKAQTAGGNIAVLGGSMTISGGTVTGGTAPAGGNISVTGGSVEISGGQIDGLVDIASVDALKLSGAPIISGGATNLHIADTAIGALDASGLEKGAFIGITVTPNTDFIRNAADVVRAAFVSDDTALSVYRDPKNNNVRLIAGHWHCVCNGSAAGVQGHTCEDVQWTAFPSGTPKENEHYYLTADRKSFLGVGTYSSTSAGTSQHYSLCLNGHTIDTTSGNHRAIGLYTASKLDICDHKNPDGSYAGLVTARGNAADHGGVLFVHGETSVLNIYGGHYVRPENADTVIWYGGILSSGGIVNIYDGLFDGTNITVTSTSYGGGTIRAVNLSIYGGTILGGTATKNGGAVYVTQSFHMSGGVIQGGTTKDGSGGCLFIGGGTAEISGGVIENGVAYGPGGGCIAMGSGTLTMTGGTVRGGVTYDKYSATNSEGVAEGFGGNIRVTGGTFNFRDGVITDGKTLAGVGAARANNGGNVAIHGTNAIMNMSGGKIVDGYSGNAGGNLYAYGTVSISGGQIINGTSVSSGQNIFNVNGSLCLSGDVYVDGGVAIHSAKELSLAGRPVISEKDSDTSTYGISLPSEETGRKPILQVHNLQKGASIGISMTVGYHGEQFGLALDGAEELAQYFYHSGNNLYQAVQNGNQLVWHLETAPKVRIGQTEYRTVAEALAAYKTGDTIVLMGSVIEDVHLKGDTILDLAGNTLVGSVTGGKLFGLDSTSTASGDGSAVGRIQGTVGAMASAVQSGGALYVYTKEADDLHSFHRVTLEVVEAYLRPVAADNEPGLYFMSRINGDDKVYQHTDSWLDSFGAAVIKNQDLATPKLSGYAYSVFGAEGFRQDQKKVPGTLVGGILSGDGGETVVYCRTYLKTADGQEFFSDNVHLTLRYMVEYADSQWEKLTPAQREAMEVLYKAHGDKMIGWDLKHRN